MTRHCDPVTMDHIIELRKRVALLEKQLENALSWVTPLREKNDKLRRALNKIADRSVDDDSWLAKSVDIRVMAQNELRLAPLKEEGKPYREDR